MNVTTMLLRKLHRISELLGVLEHDPKRRPDVMSHVIDDVMEYVALEENVLLPTAESALGASVHVLRTTHVRARLALFRMATAETESEVFARAAASLRQAFRAHALTLSDVLRGLDALPQIADDAHESTATTLAKAHDDAEDEVRTSKRTVSGVIEKIVAA